MLSEINRNASSKQWFIDVLKLCIVIGTFYAIWIGSHALFTPDEGRYSEVAREMIVSHDYVTPRLNGVAFLDKPALYYWLQASAIKVFGLTEGALRFWPAAMGVLASLVMYLMGRILFNRRTGIVSAIVLATAPLFYGAAHYANLDLEVAALIGNSLLCFIASTKVSCPRLKTTLLILAYVFSALAALTKGLIGIAFPIMVIGSWIVLLHRWAILKSMHLITGIVVFLCITAPWYVLVQKANPEFLHFFFVTQQVERFLTTQDFNSKAAVWFYVPVVLAGLFPWSIFLIQALIHHVKQAWQQRKEQSVSLFLVLWFVIVLVFFSIPRSKTVGYILPIFPVCALLVGSYMDRYWDQMKSFGVKAGLVGFGIIALCVGLFFLATPWVAATLEMPLGFVPYLQCMGVMLLGAFVLLICNRRTLTMSRVMTSLTILIVALLLTFMVSAASINEKSIKPLALYLKQHMKADEEVMTYYRYYQDLPIYLEKRVTIAADWHADDIVHNDNWLREMWYGMVFQDTKDWLIEKDTFWQRWDGPKRVYVITDQRYYNLFAKKPNVHQLWQQKDVFLFSNQAD